MELLSNQMNGVALPADPFNQIPEEEENVILSTGQALSGADLSQLAKAISTYSVVGEFYNDTGVADAYILESISPRIAIFNYQDGARIRFIANESNTGASQVNINSIGNANITNPDGSVLAPNTIQAGKSTEIVYNATNVRFEIYSTPQFKSFQKGHIFGITIENNAIDSDHDIDFQIGECRDDSNQIDIDFPSVITKKIDATWAAGTNQGGLAFGLSLTADTTYHCFILANDQGDVDAGFDEEPDGATLLADAAVISAGYTHLRRVASLVTNSAGNIFPFMQSGNHFYYLGEVLNFDLNNFGTSALIEDVYIPSRINAIAILDSEGSDAVNNPDIRISPVAGPDLAPTSSNATFSLRTNATVQSTQHMIPVDHSSVASIGQIRIRSSASTGATNLNSTSIGWIDDRNRTIS